jgi:hypothetical protein
MPWNRPDREKYAVIRERCAGDLSNAELALLALRMASSARRFLVLITAAYAAAAMLRRSTCGYRVAPPRCTATSAPASNRANGEIARGRDERPVDPNRERKSSGRRRPSRMTWSTRLRSRLASAGHGERYLGLCEKTGKRGGTATMKVKSADFRQCAGSRALPSPVSCRDTLHACSMALIRSVFPVRAGIRLVEVTLSNFQAVRRISFRQADVPRQDAALQ